MKIIDLICSIKSIPLNRTFTTAVRSTNYIHDIVVELVSDNGIIAQGSAPATTMVTGDTIVGTEFVINEYFKPKIIGMDICSLSSFIKSIDKILPFNNAAKMAVDTACYNMLAKLENKSLVEYFGSNNSKLNSCVTVSCSDTKKVLIDIDDCIKKGFKKLKIKLGKDIEKDIEIIKLIKKNYSINKEIKFIVDANQGWNLKQTLSFLSVIEKYDIDLMLLEQPVHAKDIASMKEITATNIVPIVIDEGVFSLFDAKYALEQEACDIINIKLAKCGGIYQALKIKALADTYQKKCMVGCMMESPIGIKNAASFALSSGISLVDLDPIDWVEEKEYSDIMSYNPPEIKLFDIS